MLSINLRKINLCTTAQQKAILNIRNEPSVRNSMYTDHHISLDEHLNWVEILKNDKTQIVFIILVNDIASGVLSISALDLVHKKSDWAFYLTDKVRGGLGAALEFSLLNFAFDDLLLEKLNCEVLETNDVIVKLHKKFGFIEEGFKNSNIEKNGTRIGVYFLGITKDEWVSKRLYFQEKNKFMIEKFNIRIEHTDD
jgi:UDP-4-amino-4,6-dideoxy-N-acetyl-beta-L-altrosamine N-acetyltransferase